MKYSDTGTTVEYGHTDGSWVAIRHTSPEGHTDEAFLQGDEAEEFISYAYLAADGPFGKERSLHQVFCQLAADYLP